MRRIAKIGLGFVLLVALTACVQIVRNSGDAPLTAKPEQALRLATYNVHYINLRETEGSWSVGDWDLRKGPLDAAFKALGADVAAFQEMESFGGGREADQVNLTLEYLLAQNPDYAAAAVGDPAIFPSTQPILYRKNRLQLIDQGWFFFSDTPDVIYSRTFNGSYPAYASLAQFQDRLTGKSFGVVNVHFEYKSRSNRLQSAQLVVDRVAPQIAAGQVTFMMGDTNARAGAQTMEILEGAGFDFAPVSGATYHFDQGINLFGAIDHIGAAGAAARVGEPIVLRQQFGGQWPTDHYPVIVDYQFDE